jgi:glycosyltransferase involved in cell wall biosynthesis
MACGTATIVSSIPSLSEVVGDGALKVEPNDVDGFAQAIYQLINNTNRRQQLEKEGRRRAELFSWRETARKTLLLYQDLFKSKS